MKNINDLTKQVQEVIGQAKSGKMNLEKAQAVCNGLDMIIQIYELQLEYNKLRKENDIPKIDFMECEFDDMPSDEHLTNAKSMLKHAKKELKDMRKNM